MPRYTINSFTDAAYNEVCDTTQPHGNRVGIPVARALPTDAERICRLLNEDEEKMRPRWGAGCDCVGLYHKSTCPRWELPY